MHPLKAYSKVNLILKVFPKTRHESKHKIQSLFCLYKKLYDEIVIKESDKTKIIFKSGGKVVNIKKDKILLAICYLSKLINSKLNLSIIINKKIPLMSGLGGSATDTACIINWIVKKYRFKLLPSHLKYIALHIGSDIPFFLSHCRSAWVYNLGDKVIQNTQVVPKFKVILTNIQINTTKVYESMNQGYISKVNIPKAWKSLNTAFFSKDTIYNDMWAFANKLNQKLHKKSLELLQTKKVILSGSGGSFIEIC